jgi:CPA2 family monovalent cation:H+ antiporter-2
MDNATLLVNLAFALLAAGAAAAVAARLGQSVILGYIVAGVAIGSHTPGFTADADTVEALADIGVVLLMFAIGLQVSMPELLAVGRVATAGAVSQVALLIGIGYLVARALGMAHVEALFAGAFVSNSSSTVLAKLVSERGEAGALHARVALAWSSVQDLSTIVLVVVLSAIATPDQTLWPELPLAIAKAVIFLIVLVPLGSRVLPWLFERLGSLRNREIFVLSAAGLALSAAYFASLFGLSPALGAFVAGIVISESDVRHEILEPVRPLRDIFAGLFFVSIGMFVDPGLLLERWEAVLALGALIMLVKPATVAGLLALSRYPVRTTLITALALAQSAEFSFLLARLGISLGAVSQESFSALLSAAVVSIVLSPSLHGAATRAARWAERRLPQPGLEDEEHVVQAASTMSGHVVLCGYGRVGRVIADTLRRYSIPFVVIDHDRAQVRALRSEGIPAFLGSADNATLLEQVGLDRARLLILAIPDAASARLAAAQALRTNPAIEIVARTHSAGEREALESLGVHEAVLGEFELALEMTRSALLRFEVGEGEVAGLLHSLRRDAREIPEAAPPAGRLA